MTKSVFSYFLEGLASQTSRPWIYFALNFMIFLSTAAFFLFVKHILQLLIFFNSRKILLISQSQLRIERRSLYTILLLLSALTSINTSDPVSAAAHIYSHAITLFQPYFWDEVLRSWAFLFSSFWYQKIFCFQTGQSLGGKVSLLNTASISVWFYLCSAKSQQSPQGALYCEIKTQQQFSGKSIALIICPLCLVFTWFIKFENWCTVWVHSEMLMLHRLKMDIVIWMCSSVESRGLTSM